MQPIPERQESEPSPEQIEAAVEALHHGSPAAFDELLDSVGGSSGLCGLFLEIATPGAPDVAAPTIPGYKIERVIAAGGMGVVFAAEQSGTQRTVAVKVMRGGAGGAIRTDRLFRREVDTLVRLRHPNIASLYDAGATSDGAPFFAMELVEGGTFRDYMRGAGDVDLRTDDGRNAIRRFVDVCRAMNHAHQRGVIHCDLKPTNVMMSADGTPKVLDFGLSRLIDPEMSTIAAATSTGQLAGTLAYMSPEQASGPVGEVDVRSDVYSLGVMLYELVCGTKPYRVSVSALPASIKAICETEPRRPATIRPALRGDLDAIVMKALEKDPARRYQSAGALADDLERALRGEPIEARGDRFYLLKRTLYRYRVQAGVAAAFFVVLAAATGVSTWFWYQKQREAERAEAEASRAKHVGRTAFLTVGELMDDIYDMTQEMGSQPDKISRLSAQLDTLGQVVEIDSELQVIHLMITEMKARIAFSRGEYAKSRSLYSKLLESGGDNPEWVSRAHAQLCLVPGSTNIDEHYEVARCLTQNDRDRCRLKLYYASALAAANRNADVLSVIKSIDCEGMERQMHSLRAGAYDGLGIRDVAIAEFKASLAIAEEQAARHPSSLESKFNVMQTHKALSYCCFRDRQFDNAMFHAEEAKALGEHLLWVTPNYAPLISTAWSANLIICKLQRKQHDFESAAETANEMILLIDRVIAAEPKATTWLHYRSSSLYQRGCALKALDRIDDANGQFLEARDILLRIKDDENQSREGCYEELAGVYEELGGIAQEKDNAVEQREHREKCLATCKVLCEISPDSYVFEGRTVVAALNLSVAERRVGILGTAENVECANAAIERFRKKGGEEEQAANFEKMVEAEKVWIEKGRALRSASTRPNDE